MAFLASWWCSRINPWSFRRSIIPRSRGQITAMVCCRCSWLSSPFSSVFSFGGIYNSLSIYNLFRTRVAFLPLRSASFCFWYSFFLRDSISDETARVYQVAYLLVYTHYLRRIASRRNIRNGLQLGVFHVARGQIYEHFQIQLYIPRLSLFLKNLEGVLPCIRFELHISR